MTEDSDDLMRFVRNALFDEWADQIVTGSLTEAGLRRLRDMVASDSGLCPPPDDPAVTLFRWRVGDAVADELGIPRGAMPEAPVVPDSPAGLDAQ